MCRANAIRIFREHTRGRDGKYRQKYAPRYYVRAATTRGRQKRRQRLREEEAERDEIFQERMENRMTEDEEDGMFETIEMDEVTHPQFQDPVIQRTLAHRKLQHYQSDDEKISHIIEGVLDRQRRKKRTFLKRAQNSRKRTLEFYMVDGVLYA